MKITFSTVMSIVICIVLVAGAVCIGAVKGWSSDRDAVLRAPTLDGEMSALLQIRAMDAANLCVVAARHVPADDADLLALRQASELLLRGNPAQPMQADNVITEVAQRFAQRLPAMSSVAASKRDKAYVKTLTDTLCAETSLSHNYALLVEDFNHRLSAEMTGRLAMALGVKPIESAPVQ